MPRFLRLKNFMIHVPSLSSISIQTNCLGRPSLSLYYHTLKHSVKFSYSNWTQCEADFNRVKTALAEVETLLNQVSLTEEHIKGKVKEVKVEEVVPVPTINEEKKE